MSDEKCTCGHDRGRHHGPGCLEDCHDCDCAKFAPAATAQTPCTGSGIGLIAAERAHQIAHGFNADHDDDHTDESLAQLAAHLAISDSVRSSVVLWDWTIDRAEHIAEKWKSNRIQELVIAGALIVAEIERLQRAAALAAATKEVRP